MTPLPKPPGLLACCFCLISALVVCLFILSLNRLLIP